MGKRIKKNPSRLCEGPFHNLDYKITLTFRSVPDRIIFGVIKTTGLILLVMGYMPASVTASIDIVSNPFVNFIVPQVRYIVTVGKHQRPVSVSDTVHIG